jgi:hypothetical protein
MRIWDIHPGYLARQQLLGEHRELHGLFNILTLGKKGYSSHPETLRWVGCVDALVQRHDLLVSEMILRGYKHHSPLIEVAEKQARWPSVYIDPPDRQLELLDDKYVADGREGRIPLPRNTQELWAQYKYSVMAHDPKLYREIGPEVAHGIYQSNMAALSQLLVETLRKQPDEGRVYNALQHMWGYVKEAGQPYEDLPVLLTKIQTEVVKQQRTYLMHSTALSELSIWLS